MADKKILVVDDEEELLELIAKTLEKEGYKVTTVTTAEEAMDKQVSPGVIAKASNKMSASSQHCA